MRHFTTQVLCESCSDGLGGLCSGRVLSSFRFQVANRRIVSRKGARPQRCLRQAFDMVATDGTEKRHTDKIQVTGCQFPVAGGDPDDPSCLRLSGLRSECRVNLE